MAEVVAQEKFACPACGGEGQWNPAKQAVVCPFCGTTFPPETSEGAGVKEYDLAAALRSLPESKRGWQAEKKSVRCQHCQAISVFDPQRIAQRCDFCGSTQIVPYEQVKPPISPESVLPFKLDQVRVRECIREWYRSRWFAPNRFRNAALTDTLKGVYLPYWTFDAQVHADWTAESGHYYYETETYRDAQGNRQTRQVRKVRWVPSSGSLDHFFDDELVPGSVGVHPELLRKVEPFPTKEVIPYAPSYVAGWIVEQYQLDLVGAAKHARDSMENQTESMCASQVPGDTHRNLRVRTHFTRQTFKHTLLPLWFVTYNYGPKTYQTVVNGVTGDIAGERPYSFWKITFLVLFILAVAGIIALGAR